MAPVCGIIADQYGLLAAFRFLAISIIVANMFVFFMPQTAADAQKAGESRPASPQG